MKLYTKMFAFALFAMLAGCQPAQEKNKSEEMKQEKSIVKDYAAYNLWANERYAEWLRTADTGQFHREVESSFNSLAKTVIHLWNAEAGWLNTLNREPWGAPPGAAFDGTHEELLMGWLQASKDFADYAASLQTDSLQSVYHRKDGQILGTAEELMHHVFNHATYHRGQLITIGRQVGLADPPRADYVYYLSIRESGR